MSKIGEVAGALALVAAMGATPALAQDLVWAWARSAASRRATW